MTGKGMGILIGAMEQLPLSSSVTWDENSIRIYFEDLRYDIPDEDVGMLARAILRTQEWRPTIKTIRSLWHSLCGMERRQPADVVAELIELRRRHGATVRYDPGLLEIGARLLVEGEPNWTDPVKRRVIECFGGWVAFCKSDAPASVERGQMLKIAEQILGTANDQALLGLRQDRAIEYIIPSIDDPNITRIPSAIAMLDGLDEDKYDR